MFFSMAPVEAELCSLSSKGQEGRKEEDWDVARMVEGLPSMQEAVGLTPPALHKPGMVLQDKKMGE